MPAWWLKFQLCPPLHSHPKVKLIPRLKSIFEFADQLKMTNYVSRPQRLNKEKWRSARLVSVGEDVALPCNATEKWKVRRLSQFEGMNSKVFTFSTQTFPLSDCVVFGNKILKLVWNILHPWLEEDNKQWFLLRTPQAVLQRRWLLLGLQPLDQLWPAVPREAWCCQDSGTGLGVCREHVWGISNTGEFVLHPKHPWPRPAAAGV